MRIRRSFVLLVGVMVATVAMVVATLATQAETSRSASAGHGAVPAAGARAAAEQAFGSMPVAFVANRGQTDPRVRYYAVGHRFAFFATPHELMLSLSKESPARHLALALRFLHRSPDSAVTATGRAP